MFDRKGLFKVSKSQVPEIESFELELIDFGLDDLSYDDEFIYIYTPFQEFGSMQKALEERKIEINATGLQFIPGNYKELSGEQKEEVVGLIGALEEDDDVKSVYHNMQ